MKRRNFIGGMFMAAAAAIMPWKAKAKEERPFEDKPSRWNLLDPQTGVLGSVYTARGEELFTNTGIFYEGQKLEIFSADCSTFRGSRKVIHVTKDKLILNARVPGDTQPGDLILLSGDPMPMCFKDRPEFRFKEPKRGF